MCLGAQSPACADSKNSAAKQEEFFELKIRPLLVEKCLDCHSGDENSESALAVDSRQALIDGGDFGPAIVPGKAHLSLLIQAVKRTHKELRMPPEESDALSSAEISDLVTWINNGAVWPGDANSSRRQGKASKPAFKELEVDPVHDWALQPRQVVKPPSVSDERWAETPVDRFLEARRAKAGVKAVARADRRTLIRRATQDLTGLPPEPEDVAQFLQDPRDDKTAFSALVDRLLASSQYGERAARLWLDVARYADTQGDVGDYPIHTAWLYRNWVIDSLNADMPIDRFLQAQIAGDLLARETTDAETARGLNVATGFISLSRRFGNTKRDDAYLTIEDTIDTIGRGVLGMTVRCARCHDHKFDPILNTDYYGLYGIFDSTVYPSMGMSNEKSPSNLVPAVPDAEAAAGAQEYWKLIGRYEYQVNNHSRPWLMPTLTEFKRVNQLWQARRNANATASALKPLTAERNALLARHDGRFRELMLHGLDWLKKEKQQLAENPPYEFVFAVSEGSPHDAKIHRRGNPKQLGPVTARRFLQAIDGPEPAEISEGSGRLELARWITRPDHPLTARVFVNRIWQQHFGRGLVETLDNFGRQGSKPSHPRLLDWLADTFVKDGWSLKKLHRRLMLSESYQLDSVATEDQSLSDSDNILLTRFQRRRLDAESIRDSMLAVSGELDRSQGHAHAIKPWYSRRYSLNSPFHNEPPTNRRSIYLLTQRLFRHSILDHFDGPDRNSTTAQRRASNVPSQALFLMNSKFVRERAEALARNLQSVDADRERLNVLFMKAFGRTPEPNEMDSLLNFLSGYRSANEAATDGKLNAELIAVSRTVLTSNEFFFID